VVNAIQREAALDPQGFGQKLLTKYNPKLPSKAAANDISWVRNRLARYAVIQVGITQPPSPPPTTVMER
jgi:hypothetical protein